MPKVINAKCKAEVPLLVAITCLHLIKEEIFFSNIRNLVITGYFSSEVGINDLGYKGNQPNFWDGVPDDIMQAHGFSYEKDWKYDFIDPMTRNDVAKWDENGNLIS